jgi:hypothetical protein
VYPSLANLLTLTSGVLSPDKMSVSLALLVNCSKGSSVMWDACNLVFSGNYTSLFDFPFFGRFISSSTKFDVAPELITNFIFLGRSTRHVHLFDFMFAIDCTTFGILLSSIWSSSSVSWNGAQ